MNRKANIKREPSSNNCEDVVNNTSRFPRKYPLIKLEMQIKGIKIHIARMDNVQSLLHKSLSAINGAKIYSKIVIIRPFIMINNDDVMTYFLLLYGFFAIKYDKTFGNEKEQIVIIKTRRGFVKLKIDIAENPKRPVKTIFDNRENTLAMLEDKSIIKISLVLFFCILYLLS